jgi:hypothetical protein
VVVLQPDDFAVADQMLQAFPVDKGFRLGSHSYFETLYSSESPLESRESVLFDQVGVDLFCFSFPSEGLFNSFMYASRGFRIKAEMYV